MTNVPFPTFGPTGFVSPTETAILAGLQEDFNAAFQTEFDFGTPTNPTPQGQITTTEAACIGNANDNFVVLSNSVDPAFASGRMQDAIGRIYFITRLPAQSTIVDCLCIGSADTEIPAGATAKALDGNIYTAISGGIIPLSESITLEFACQITGPIPCSANTVTQIYKTIPGWDSINNEADGVLGNVVESRTAFETRRQQTVAHNSTGFLDSVLGAVLTVDGVLDAYATENPNGFEIAYSPDAVIAGTISGTTLTVAGVTSGAVKVGQSIAAAPGSVIAIADGTEIVSGSGTSWQVNNSQTVGLTSMALGGVVLNKNSLYVAAVGGTDDDVAAAIWSKKSPGCAYYDGNTSVTVYDTAVQYTPPGVPYVVGYERPPGLPFVFAINIANSSIVPVNAAALIQAAIISAFAGADGGVRARIGSTVFASRFYPAVAALGVWAEVISIFLGTPNVPAADATASIGWTATGTGAGTNLTLSSVVGYVSAGDIISGPGIPNGTAIVSQSSGTTGSDGVYITTGSTTASADALQAISSVLDVTAIADGSLALGQSLFDLTGDIPEGTTILSQISGTAGSTGRYRISAPLLVASEAVTFVAATLTFVPVRINQAPTVIAANIQVNLI